MSKKSLKKSALLFSLLLSLVLAFAFSNRAFADSTETYEDETTYSSGNVYIRDEAGIIDDRAALSESMQDFTTYGKAAFITTNYGYEDADEIEGVYDECIGYGQDGFLLLIDMSSRRILIYTDGSVYRTINENYANTITDNIYKYASNGDYEGMVKEAFSEATDLMAGRKVSQPMRIITSALMAVAIALLICFLIAEAASGAIFAPHTEFSMNRVGIFNRRSNFIRETRVYVPPSSSSGGGGSSGGGHSGGGGGHSF